MLENPALFLLSATLGLLVLLVALVLRLLRQRRSPEARSESVRPPPQALELGRGLLETIRQLEAENRRMHHILAQLPSFTNNLTVRLEKREVPPLLTRMLQRLFDPVDVLLFLRDRRGDRELVLAERLSSAPGPECGARVRIGEGAVGQVAELQLVMNDADFATQAKFHSKTAAALGPHHQRPDLCAPLVMEGETHGVVALYGVRLRGKNEKQLLRLFTDLGALALQYVNSVNDLRHRAHADGLTELYNKRYFMQLVAEHLHRAQETGAPLAMLMLDIDHFKNYNDVHGHIAGDEALKLTARILRENLREDDVAARFGGEEFVVLFPDTAKDQAFEAAEKLRRAIEEQPYPAEELQPLGKVTISGGVAAHPNDALSARDLIAAADEALYRAKQSGRNRVLLYEPQYLSAADDPPVQITADLTGQA